MSPGSTFHLKIAVMTGLLGSNASTMDAPCVVFSHGKANSFLAVDKSSLSSCTRIHSHGMIE